MFKVIAHPLAVLGLRPAALWISRRMALDAMALPDLVRICPTKSPGAGSREMIHFAQCVHADHHQGICIGQTAAPMALYVLCHLATLLDGDVYEIGARCTNLTSSRNAARATILRTSRSSARQAGRGFIRDL